MSINLCLYIRLFWDAVTGIVYSRKKKKGQYLDQSVYANYLDYIQFVCEKFILIIPCFNKISSHMEISATKAALTSYTREKM